MATICITYCNVRQLGHTGCVFNMMQYTTVISIYMSTSNWLVKLMETYTVLCEVRNESLCITHLNFSLQSFAGRNLKYNPVHLGAYPRLIARDSQ